MSIYYNLTETTTIDDPLERPLTITNFSTKKTITNLSDYSVGVKRFKIPIQTVPYSRVYENRYHIGYNSANNTPYKLDRVEGSPTHNQVRNKPIDVFGSFRTEITDLNAFVPFSSGVYNDYYVDKLYTEPTTPANDTTDTSLGNHYIPIKDDAEFCSVMTRALNHSLYAGIPPQLFIDGQLKNGGYIVRSNATQMVAINTVASGTVPTAEGAGWFAINTLLQSTTDLHKNACDYKISITDFDATPHARICDMSFRLRITYAPNQVSFIDLGGGYFKDGGNSWTIPSVFGFTPTSASRTRGDGFINWSPYARFSSNYMKGDSAKRGFNKMGMFVYPASNDDLDMLLGRNCFGQAVGVNAGSIVLEARTTTSTAFLVNTNDTNIFNIASSITVYAATTSTVLRQNSTANNSQIYSSPRFTFNETMKKIELRSHAIDQDERATAGEYNDKNSNLFDSRAELFMNNRLLNVLGFKSNSRINTIDIYNNYFQSPPKNTIVNPSIDFGGILELENIYTFGTNENFNSFSELSTNTIPFFNDGTLTFVSPTYLVWREKETSVFKRNFLWGLEMITNRLPIEGEITGDGNSQKKILTDFVADPSSVVRDFLLYQPEGNAVRYYPLNSDQALDSVDIIVNYTDINGIVRPLTIGIGNSASIKLEFRPTNMINNY